MHDADEMEARRLICSAEQQQRGPSRRARSKARGREIAGKTRQPSEIKTAKLDLLQLNNVRNRRQSLARLKAWKAQRMPRLQPHDGRVTDAVAAARGPGRQACARYRVSHANARYTTCCTLLARVTFGSVCVAA